MAFLLLHVEEEVTDSQCDARSPVAVDAYNTDPEEQYANLAAFNLANAAKNNPPPPPPPGGTSAPRGNKNDDRPKPPDDGSDSDSEKKKSDPTEGSKKKKKKKSKKGKPKSSDDESKDEKAKEKKKNTIVGEDILDSPRRKSLRRNSGEKSDDSKEKKQKKSKNEKEHDTDKRKSYDENEDRKINVKKRNKNSEKDDENGTVRKMTEINPEEYGDWKKWANERDRMLKKINKTRHEKNDRLLKESMLQDLKSSDSPFVTTDESESNAMGNAGMSAVNMTRKGPKESIHACVKPKSKHLSVPQTTTEEDPFRSESTSPIRVVRSANAKKSQKRE
ncbi:hypothetical protein QR680_014657 [Steinernema hermaphroditum]|uniref:Uncharacterized protein n=1 Tax=Steinernema hermaphroditum TaxID=289476 RepID=A0AA39M4M4_9BILA|nr:hypothetical protein QR680_014657 [Steinernema hermaphroditum]